MPKLGKYATDGRTNSRTTGSIPKGAVRDQTASRKQGSANEGRGTPKVITLSRFSTKKPKVL